MAATPVPVPIENLVGFVQWIEVEDPARPLWYRGCARPMVPFLYRCGPRTQEENRALEAALTARFRQRWVPFQTRSLDSPWEILFIMQHHGTPTRLLDWSEMPYVGLYFAIEAASFRDQDGQVTYPSDATLWVLDPTTWNRSLGRAYEGILLPGDARLRGYGENQDDWELRGEAPVAVTGTYNSARMVAQKGVFTVFGNSSEALEDYYLRDIFSEGTLRRLLFPATSLPDTRESLFRLGVTHSVLFPDLEHLSMDLRREYGFGG